MTREEATPGAVAVETDTPEGASRLWFVVDVVHAGPLAEFDVVNLRHPTRGASSRWLMFMRLATPAEIVAAGMGGC